MLSIQEARTKVTESLVPIGVEQVVLADAVGRSLGDDLFGVRSMPGETNSAMDGYAVRASDGAGPLPVTMTIPAGVMPGPLAPGRAARIFTGAPVPEGADAIVIQEDAVRDGDLVRFTAPPVAGEHMRWRGADIAEGEILLKRGARITPGVVALLASQGMTHVVVGRRPRVVIVPNGDEIVPIDADLAPGQVPNTNTHMLTAQVLAAGGVPMCMPPVPDRPEAVADALGRAVQDADLVLTTGGMSVGDFDFARDALAVDGEMAFYKVRMKPGKPLGLGRIAGVPVLGLPGNPVSAFVGFELFGRPMVRTLAGFLVVDRPRFQAPLAQDVRQNRTRPEYQRCDVRDGELVPWRKQGSSMISSLVHADALALVPQGEGVLPRGTVVEAVDLRAD